MSTQEKIKLFYLETDLDITFYSSQNDKKLLIYKTEENYKKFKKLLKSNKFDFVKLI